MNIDIFKDNLVKYIFIDKNIKEKQIQFKNEMKTLKEQMMAHQNIILEYFNEQQCESMVVSDKGGQLKKSVKNIKQPINKGNITKSIYDAFEKESEKEYYNKIILDLIEKNRKVRSVECIKLINPRKKKTPNLDEDD